jgi:hypothetical protein
LMPGEGNKRERDWEDAEKADGILGRLPLSSPILP